jgi:hypothetical protein
LSPKSIYLYKNLEELVNDYQELKYEYRELSIKNKDNPYIDKTPIFINLKNLLYDIGRILERNGYNLEDL